MEERPTFNADPYIFCYFNACSYETADPLNLDQWEFYAFTKKRTLELLGNRKSISLTSLKRQGIRAIKANELKHRLVPSIDRLKYSVV